MTVLTGNEITDLKVEINTAAIWNDVRVMLPSYGYTLELKDDGWHKYPVDLVARSTDGASINKYGRRTKTQSKHVIEQGFAEAYCDSEIEKYKEPAAQIDMNLIGSNATNILMALTARVAQQISYQYTPAGLAATGLVDNLTLDVDMDGVPRLTLNISEVRSLDLLDWFIIDTDLIDGMYVIG